MAVPTFTQLDHVSGWVMHTPLATTEVPDASLNL